MWKMPEVFVIKSYLIFTEVSSLVYFLLFLLILPTLCKFPCFLQKQVIDSHVLEPQTSLYSPYKSLLPWHIHEQISHYFYAFVLMSHSNYTHLSTPYYPLPTPPPKYFCILLACFYFSISHFFLCHMINIFGKLFF